MYFANWLGRGGDDCDHDTFRFTACGKNTANNDDYKGTGHDKRHLANTETSLIIVQLIYKPLLLQCYPQTRVMWKQQETKIWALSHQSL